MIKLVIVIAIFKYSRFDDKLRIYMNFILFFHETAEHTNCDPKWKELVYNSLFLLLLRSSTRITLAKGFLKWGHKICFHRESKEIILQLFSNTILSGPGSSEE